MRLTLLLLIVSLVVPAGARAQEAGAADELAVPPPPTTPMGPPPTLAVAPPLVSGVPLDLLVAPLLAAAEADLAAGRIRLALIRATIVGEALPEGLPLRVRADGLRLLANRRLAEELAPSPLGDVLAPLVIQAELDLRAGQPQIALPRLDFALARLPAASPLAARAHQLRQVAVSSMGAPLLPPPQPASALTPPPSAPEPPSDGHRGTAEAVELYITAGAFGALTGGYIPFMASQDTAGGATYILTTVAGAGLLAVGVLSLDLTSRIPSGVPPTISSSIRFGFAHGLLAWGLYESSSFSVGEPGVIFSLVWGGTLAGGLLGTAVGFGLTPSVDEARLVESTGLWGAGLGTYIAMMTGYRDATTGLGLMLGGMDAGLLVGVLLAALDIVPPVRRTLALDLGFLVGSGVGALLPGFYYASTGLPLEMEPLGVGMALGAIGGWVLAYFLTEDAGAPDVGERVSLGIAPVEGGATLAVSGML